MSQSAHVRASCLLLILVMLSACRNGEEPAARAKGPAFENAAATPSHTAVSVQVEPPGQPAIVEVPVEYDEEEVHAVYLRTVERQGKYRDYATSQLHRLMGQLDPQRAASSFSSANTRRPGCYTTPMEEARMRQAEAQVYQMERRASGGHGGPTPPSSIVNRVLPMLCAAVDSRDRLAALQSINLARSLTDDLRERVFDAPKLAICEQLGEDLFLARHYSSPYLNFRAWLYRIQRQGGVSAMADDLTFAVLYDRVGDGMVDAAAGELFHYVGNYDLALVFYWTALEKMEQNSRGSRRLWLVLDDSNRLHVLLRPRHAGRVAPVFSFTEELPNSQAVRRVRAGRAEQWKKELAQSGSVAEVAWGPVNSSGNAAEDLRRGMILAGLADCFLSRGHRQWAVRLAEAAIRVCDHSDTSGTQSRMLAQGGESGFPSDFYTVPARALRILGQADLEFLLSVAGPGFPEKSRIRRDHRRFVERARQRLTEAYQVCIDGGRWADTLNTAYELARLEILERTDGGATPQTFTELRNMVSPEAMLSEQPRQWCKEVEPPKAYPFDIQCVVDLRFLEKRGSLVAKLACLAGDKDAAREESEYFAAWWRRVHARTGGEPFRFSLAYSENPRYERLIYHLIRVGLHEEALKWSERVRHRALLDVIGQGRARDKFVSSRRSREMFEFAAKRFAELQNVLPVEEISELRIPGSTRMESTEFMDAPELPDFLASLPEQTAVINYHLFEKSGVAWILSRDGMQTVTLPVGKGQSRELIRRWRKALDTEATRGVGGVVSTHRGAGMEPRTDAATRELYDHLVAPVAKHAARFRHWCIIPHGPLRYLSFAALSDGHELCLDQHAISYLWSLNALPRLVALQRPKRLDRIACLGNPDTGNPKDALPFTEVEVREVARLFGQSSVYTGSDASYYRLAVSAGNADILHLACHALPVDEYGNRALLLAPTDRHSGRVSYDALYRIETPAFLATLSCCSTGLGQEMAGDEFLGFSRGFLAASVPSLVISLWDVPDESTAKLITEFYRQLREHDLATSLQKAQQKTAASHPSPWYWAAFTVYGVWDPAAPDPR